MQFTFQNDSASVHVSSIFSHVICISCIVWYSTIHTTTSSWLFKKKKNYDYFFPSQILYWLVSSKPNVSVILIINYVWRAPAYTSEVQIQFNKTLILGKTKLLKEQCVSYRCLRLIWLACVMEIRCEVR